MMKSAEQRLRLLQTLVTQALIVAVGSVTLLVANTSLAADSKSRPNIVVILADDMGYGDPQCYNPESKISTPNIDRLAAEGMRFTDGHTPAAWCTPTRYALLTGRYPFRLGNVRATRPLIEKHRLTVASLLKQVGYRTAMVGKWHLGVEHEQDPGSHRLTGGPVDCGFDEYFGIPASLDIPDYYWIRGAHAVKPPTKPIEASSSEDQGWTRIQGAFWREGLVAEGFEHEQVLPRLEDEAVAFLNRHHGESPDQPFLLYFALPAPHTPWLPLQEYRGKSGAGMYGDFVMQVDDTVGRILRTLDELNLADNTLVLFSSDNGPVWYDQDFKRFGHRAAGPWRGMKGDSYEGGHRVPFIMRWPGEIPAGSVNDKTVCQIDFIATVAAITRQELPRDAGEDSFNMLPLMRGESTAPNLTERDALLLRANRGEIVRAGPWKLVPWLGSGGFSKPSHIKRRPGDPPGQLYNLEQDPGETQNVWEEYPEVVKRLTGALKRYREADRSRP